MSVPTPAPTKTLPGNQPPPGVAATATRIANGELTAAAATETALTAIAEHNPQLHAFVAVFGEHARHRAAELDAQAAAGAQLGPLHGVPIAVKDENDIAGTVTGLGGRAFTTPAAADSEIVARLRRAGAVIVGKTAMPEFGIWPFTESRASGLTRNPWTPPDAPPRSPAGSSGGSAAAVSAGLVPAAIGGDGGGSIRLPAAWCGLFGLKLGRGRITCAPNPDLWRSLGTLGPLTRSVDDAALIYDAIAGTIATDRWRAADPLPALRAAAATDPGPLRIAVAAIPPVRGIPAPDPAVLAALADTAAELAAAGHEVVETDPRYPLVTVEFLMEMLGGIRDEAARADRPDLLEARTRRIVRLGALADGPRRAAWAQRRLVRVSDDWNTGFFRTGTGGVDVLLTPTIGTTAVLAGQLDSASLIHAARVALPVAAYTSIWNLLGNPAASLPAGFDDAALPIGVQIVAAPGREDLVVAVAAQLERANARHRVRTPY
ncbi:MAG: amidase family protein [Gordonia sp. (in: high G+C Gram-positive bacteria)]